MNILAHEKQIHEYEELLERLKSQNHRHDFFSNEEIVNLEKRLKELKEKVYSNLSAWDRVAISRHPGRPQASDYIRFLSEDFVEIFGDRNFRDDPAVITGFGTIEKTKFAFVGLEKGKNTEDRLYRNFGMAHPEGYRKALRIMQLAEKFRIPIVCFLDTPGAYPGLAAEERGQGWAIAKNLFEMAKLQTPIIVILIGEGCSGGALGIGVGDVIGMLENSYYSVISPEGCASILWNDTSKNAKAAETLKMGSEDLLTMQIIDEIILEPQGGAHKNPQFVFQNVKNFILSRFLELKSISYEELLNKRYLKFRKMGKFANISL